MPFQLFRHGFPHEGIAVHREDDLRIGNVVDEAAQRPVDMVHGRAQIFPAVGRHEDDPLMFFDLLDFLIFKGVVFFHGRQERVDDCIPHDVDIFPFFIFPKEIGPRRLGGGEVVPGEDAGKLAVRFFREGREEIARAEARFHMTHGNLRVEGGERRGKRGGGIAVDEDAVGPLFREDFLKPPEHAPRDVVEGLPLRHDIQVIVRFQMEEIHHLIEHLPVLRGHADFRLDLGMAAQLLNDGRHFDRFGTGPEYGHNFHCKTSFDIGLIGPLLPARARLPRARPASSPRGGTPRAPRRE